MDPLKGLFQSRPQLKTLLVLFLLAPSLGAQTVNVWETTADQSQLLAQQGNLAFAGTSANATYTITLSDTTTYQTMDGFGAAMCDSSSYVMGAELTAAQRASAVTALFDPNNGIGLSMCRLPMGASDISLGNYSYDDNGGAADPTMAHFSIAHDLTYTIPLLKQALALNPNFKIMGTPWSPPGWMKDSGTMNGGNFLPQYYGAYAQYFVKFIQGYQAQGLPIWAISCQNEPLYNATGYPGMYFPATQELEFIRNYLGPALEAAGLNTKILVYDHNWDQYVYPETVLSDPTADFYSFGTAWHWYGGVVSNQQYLQNGYSSKPQWITEAASGTWTGNFAQSLVNDLQQLVIGGTQYWGKGAIKWPFAVDQNYGPQNGGCNTCWGIISVNTNSQTYSKGVGYYTLGQVSKFMKPGAYHVQSNSFGAGNIEDVAFKNPDGSDVVVALNSSGSTQSFKIVLNGQSFTTSLPSGAVATYKWSTGTVIAPPTASPTPQAASTWRVNAGGAAYTDGSGNVWAADTQFVGGGVGTNTGTVAGTTDQSLYQTERYGGSFLYAFQAPAGIYQVTLKFSENYWTAAGQRKFNVSINGGNVLTNFDIFASAGGQNKAIDEVFNNVQPDALGRILIQFGPASADNAKVDAIQIVRVGTPSPTATATRTATPTSTPTPIILSTWRVVAGGPAHTDCQGNVWAADENYSGGTGATSTNTITGALPCTSDQALYQDQRYGNPFSYSFNVPAGSYQVTLKFAETYWTAAGQRVFNVLINGVTVLTNFDIFATAGAQNKAIDEVFNNIAASGGTITIQFGPAGVDNALVDSIQIIPQPPTPTFTATATRTFTFSSTPTRSSTPTSTLSFTPSSTPTHSFTPTFSFTPSFTNTPVPPTATWSSTPTDSMTATPTATASFTSTRTNTQIPPTATWSSTPTATETFTLSPFHTFTQTTSFTFTQTPTSTFTSTSTSTNTLVPPTSTATTTATNSSTSSSTPTEVSASTFTSTSTVIITFTSTPTNSGTPTSTSTSSFTNTGTATLTSTPTFTNTSTFTRTGTSTPSFTSTSSNTATSTSTSTATRSFTPTPTSSFTSTSTRTNTPIPPTATWSSTPTATLTFTPSPFHTFTRTPTSTFTPTRTLTPTPGISACSGLAPWNGNFVWYAIGAKVNYNGEKYQCIQAHSSEPNWMPPVVPALWQDLGPCSAVTTASVFPNPSASSNLVQVAVPITTVSDVDITIYTTNFRKVGHKAFAQVAVGSDLPLVLTDDWGGQLANGLYYVAAQAQGKTWIVKLLILH